MGPLEWEEYMQNDAGHAAANRSFTSLILIQRENFAYSCDFDIRDLINLDDVMEEFGYGPNGGLVYHGFLLQNSE